MDRILLKRARKSCKRFESERWDASSETITGVVGEGLSLDLLIYKIGKRRRLVGLERQDQRNRTHTERLFRYSRNSPPRSKRLSANSTGAFRNPSLSPAS